MTDQPTGGMEGDLDSPPTRKAVRRHLRVIEQAVYGGWDLPEAASQKIPETLREIMEDPNASVRDRIRASECLAALRRDRVEAAIQLDRIMRLDAGSATDRVEITQSLSDAALKAVADSILPPADPCPPKRKPRKG